jgi:hypothetical protein
MENNDGNNLSLSQPQGLGGPTISVTRLGQQKSNTMMQKIDIMHDNAQAQKRRSILPIQHKAKINKDEDKTDESVTRRLTTNNRISLRSRNSQGIKSGNPTYQRRISNYGANPNALSGRTSVNVRKASVNLSTFDEAMPIGGHVRRFSNMNQQTNLHTNQNNNRRISHMSRRSIIPVSNMDNLNDGPWTVENEDRRISKSNKVGKAVRAISTNIKAAMVSKEEESMDRVFRFVWIFVLILVLLSGGEVSLIIFDGPLSARIILSLFQLITLALLLLLPRKILSQSFIKSLEKSQRFQNLQNVFIQKEIRDFNRELEVQGF